jgi:tripartite-type tricarboxylate transporter receptor subunit TctC
VPGYEAIAWQGVLAPAGTPQTVLARLNAELGKILGQPDARKLLLEQGFEPAATSAAQFAEFIRTEIAKWTKVTRAAGIKE